MTDNRYEVSYIASPPGTIDPVRADFAKAAMVVILQSEHMLLPLDDYVKEQKGKSDITLADAVARESVLYTDALITQLKQTDK